MTSGSETMAGRWQSKPDWWLIAMLACGLLLRVILAEGGGQRYFPDEARYKLSGYAVEDIRHGNFSKAMRDTFSRGDHLGFRVLMMPLAYAQQKHGWSDNTVSIFCSGLTSLGSILWVYGISRRLGAERPEARWAALLMLASNSMFYWSNHFMPYDLALWFALGAMYVGVHPAARWYHSLFAGFLGFCAFVTYNGYWTIVGIALVVHVLLAWPSLLRLPLRALLAGLGLAVPMLILLNGADVLGYPLIDSYYEFAGSIVQGDYDFGHRMIPEYLWYAETGLFAFWVFAMLWFLQAWLRGAVSDWRRPAIGLLGVFVLVGCLIGLSDFAEKFMVYGRLIRQLVPFFALTAAWTCTRLGAAPSGARWRPVVLAAAIVALGAVNQARTLWIPWDFPQQAQRFIDSMAGKPLRPGEAPVEVGLLQVLSQGYIWPMPQHFDLPPHEVVLRVPHPLEFRPFLYEGFNRQQREAILNSDIADRVMLYQSPAK
ncbi:MAG: hypothetical protein RL324_2099 [Verrucomicrobiota bacterium]